MLEKDIPTNPGYSSTLMEFDVLRKPEPVTIAPVGLEEGLQQLGAVLRGEKSFEELPSFLLQPLPLSEEVFSISGSEATAIPSFLPVTSRMIEEDKKNNILLAIPRYFPKDNKKYLEICSFNPEAVDEAVPEQPIALFEIDTDASKITELTPTQAFCGILEKFHNMDIFEMGEISGEVNLKTKNSYILFGSIKDRLFIGPFDPSQVGPGDPAVVSRKSSGSYEWIECEVHHEGESIPLPLKRGLIYKETDITLDHTFDSPERLAIIDFGLYKDVHPKKPWKKKVETIGFKKLIIKSNLIELQCVANKTKPGDIIGVWPGEDDVYRWYDVITSEGIRLGLFHIVEAGEVRGKWIGSEKQRYKDKVTHTKRTIQGEDRELRMSDLPVHFITARRKGEITLFHISETKQVSLVSEAISEGDDIALSPYMSEDETLGLAAFTIPPEDSEKMEAIFFSFNEASQSFRTDWNISEASAVDAVGNFLQALEKKNISLTDGQYKALLESIADRLEKARVIRIRESYRDFFTSNEVIDLGILQPLFVRNNTHTYIFYHGGKTVHLNLWNQQIKEGALLCLLPYILGNKKGLGIFPVDQNSTQLAAEFYAFDSELLKFLKDKDLRESVVDKLVLRFQQEMQKNNTPLTEVSYKSLLYSISNIFRIQHEEERKLKKLKELPKGKAATLLLSGGILIDNNETVEIIPADSDIFSLVENQQLVQKILSFGLTTPIKYYNNPFPYYLVEKHALTYYMNRKKQKSLPKEARKNWDKVLTILKPFLQDLSQEEWDRLVARSGRDMQMPNLTDLLGTRDYSHKTRIATPDSLQTLEKSMLSGYAQRMAVMLMEHPMLKSASSISADQITKIIQIALPEDPLWRNISREEEGPPIRIHIHEIWKEVRTELEKLLESK